MCIFVCSPEVKAAFIAVAVLESIIFLPEIVDLILL